EGRPWTGRGSLARPADRDERGAGRRNEVHLRVGEGIRRDRRPRAAVPGHPDATRHVLVVLEILADRDEAIAVRRGREDVLVPGATERLRHHRTGREAPPWRQARSRWVRAHRGGGAVRRWLGGCRLQRPGGRGSGRASGRRNERRDADRASKSGTNRAHRRTVAASRGGGTPPIPSMTPRRPRPRPARLAGG